MDCPECGHQRGKPHGQPWFVRLFRLKPWPAMCHELFHGAGGYAEACGCTAPFHGS